MRIRNGLYALKTNRRKPFGTEERPYYMERRQGQWCFHHVRKAGRRYVSTGEVVLSWSWSGSEDGGDLVVRTGNWVFLRPVPKLKKRA